MSNELRFKASMKDDVSGPLGRLRDRFTLLQKQGAKGIMAGVGAAATLKAFSLVEGAAHQLGQAIGNSVNDASALQESMSKVRVVFGQNSAAIEKWADTASSAFGQSKQQALEAAGTYGNLFQAFGIGQEKAAAMSKTLVELAADLASFNNTSVEDAIIALRSGLSGETEPLKRYGVALNDARMRQELMAQGVKNLGTVLTAEQKALAAYSIIMKDTALAQGDFARTSDGLANKQRILDAKWADLSARIGSVLLPAITGLVDVGIQLADAFTAIGDAAGELGRIFDPVADAAGNVGNAFTSLSNLLPTLFPDVDWKDRISKPIIAEADRIKYDGAGKFGEAAGVLGSALTDKLTEAKNRAVTIVRQTPGELAEALRGARSAWQGAIDLLTSDLENEMTTAAEIAAIQGHLAGEALARGLKSADPVVRAQAEQTRMQLLVRLNSLQGQLFTSGSNMGGSLADGLRSSIPRVKHAAEQVAASVRNRLRVASPAKEGPWSEAGGPEGWGARFAKLLAKGLNDNLPSVTPPGFGAFAPAFAGAGAASSVTNNYILNASGVGIRDQNDAVATMARMVSLATSTPNG